MSLSALAIDLIERRAEGRTLTLRRRNSITASPVLSAPLSAGNTALTLKHANAQSRLTGRVVKGAVFSITGISGTYTVLIDTEASVSGIISVVFTPEIPTGQSALTGAAVTFSQSYSDVTYPYLRRASLEEDEKMIEGGTQARILPYSATKPAPRQNDELDGTAIKSVKVIDADDGIAYYRCIIGDPPS